MFCQIKFHVVDQFLCQNNPLDLVVTGFCWFLPPCLCDTFLKSLILKAIIFLTQWKGGRRTTNTEWVFGFVKIIHRFQKHSSYINHHQSKLNHSQFGGWHCGLEKRMKLFLPDPGQLHVNIWQIATWSVLTRQEHSARLRVTLAKAVSYPSLKRNFAP